MFNEEPISEAELEFIKAITELQIIKEEPIEYRIHHENGLITGCSMQNHPVDTKYFIVNKDIYDNYFLYQIVNGQLEKIDTNPGYVVQLKKSTQGAGVIKNNASLLLEPTESSDLETEYYAFRDN